MLTIKNMKEQFETTAKGIRLRLPHEEGGMAYADKVYSNMMNIPITDDARLKEISYTVPHGSTNYIMLTIEMEHISDCSSQGVLTHRKIGKKKIYESNYNHYLGFTTKEDILSFIEYLNGEIEKCIFNIREREAEYIQQSNKAKENIRLYQDLLDSLCDTDTDSLPIEKFDREFIRLKEEYLQNKGIGA